MGLKGQVRNRNILFITTHRIDYIRNTQELDILRSEAKSVKCIYINANNHIVSALKILLYCFFFT